MRKLLILLFVLGAAGCAGHRQPSLLDLAYYDCLDNEGDTPNGRKVCREYKAGLKARFRRSRKRRK